MTDRAVARRGAIFPDFELRANEEGLAAARRQHLRADHAGLRARDTEHKAAVALREYLARRR